jgi:hypothetical protein
LPHFFPSKYWVYCLQLLQLLPFGHFVFIIHCLRSIRQYAKKFKSYIISVTGKAVFFVMMMNDKADSSGRHVKSVGPRPVAFWDCGFE